MDDRFAGIGRYLDEVTGQVGWAKVGQESMPVNDGGGIELLEYRFEAAGQPRMHLDICSIPEQGVITAELWMPADLSDALTRDDGGMTADDIAIRRRVWACAPHEKDSANAQVIGRELAAWVCSVPSTS